MSSPGKRPRVLLVDDNAAVRKTIHLLVTSLGWDVMEASRAKEALEILDKTHFDLAIIDIQMPGICGIELCRAIRREVTPSSPEVIILSGFVDYKTRKEAMEAGAKIILEKPIGRDGMLAAFKKCGLHYTEHAV